jgi:signal transduction histidine kinase
MIVHDIRNTLTVAATCGGMLPQETEHLPPERQADARELIHNLNQCVDRTIHYLNDMLVLAKSESGRLVPQLHDLDLRDLLTGTARHCEPIAQPARISIAVETPPEPLPVRGDVHLLTRTLDNLLLNAIKYSPPGGVVRLRAELAGSRTPGETSGRIQVCVADEGGGVHPSVRQHLFQAFASDTAAPTLSSCRRLSHPANPPLRSSSPDLALSDWCAPPGAQTWRDK